MKKLRILHIHHALYIPHLIVKGLRNKGYKAHNVYYNFNGPSKDLTWACDFNLKSGYWGLFPQIAFFIKSLFNYDVFHFWGNPYMIEALFYGLYHPLFWDLALLKKFKKKIVFSSDGCFSMIKPTSWKKFVDRDICHICQTTQGDTYGFCSNRYVERRNKGMEKYADLRFGVGMGYDYEENAEFFFFPVDLDRWNTDIIIPKEKVYPRKYKDSILIYHGVGNHVIGNRGNIKGTQWIVDCIENMRQKGINVELMYIDGCPNNEVRFYQAQADIVVDQLLVGGGGQNSRECLALGKPVLTRIHSEQYEPQRKGAAPFDPPPYIPTDRNNLEENLLMLVEDEKMRKEYGRKSAEFARNVLSIDFCANRLLDFYSKL